YAMMDGAQKKAVHLNVGRLLLRNTEEESLSEVTFEIVDHLNTGAELVTGQAKRDEIARLNLIACRKAGESTAYEAMLKYVNQGIGLLGKDSWDTGYELTLSLYNEAVEAEYLNTRFERAEKLADIVLKKAHTLLDKIRVYETIIQSHFAQTRMQAAIDTGMTVLKMLGVTLSKAPPRDFNIEYFHQLPRIEDPEKLSVLRILKLMWAPVTISKQQLLPTIIFTLVNRCITDGNSPYSSFIYAVYGMFLCWDTETIEKGYQFGELALGMLEQFESREMASRVLELVYFIYTWKRHMRIVINKLRELVNLGLETGDIEVACNAHMSVCIILYFIGEPLESVCLEQAQHIESIRKLKQDFQLKLVSIWGQL
ncbi:serine/threonine protein kinase, partial [bacterium]|nr:serine/threonine protein kinase [bacterium]